MLAFSINHAKHSFNLDDLKESLAVVVVEVVQNVLVL